MPHARIFGGCLLALAPLVHPPKLMAVTSDSTYSTPDLRASTAPPWRPTTPEPAARPWETALRFPGRLVSLPLVVLGDLAERSALHLEKTDALDAAVRLNGRLQSVGLVMLPASLGDRTGFGGELRWAPPRLDNRLLFEANATTGNYNRERASAYEGPLSVVYTSEWRPRELYFGPGMNSPIAGETNYASRSQSARLAFSWGWQRYDSARVQPAEPLMFRDRMHARGPQHRTWFSAWAGPRERLVSRGRDPESLPLEVVHPLEAAVSLDRRIENFTYGAGFAHDARSGRPHWSRGWRASIEGERFDRSLRAFALTDASSGAPSFTRLTYRGEAAASFGRDPRTVRLEFRAVDQRLDGGAGVTLLGDVQTLGGNTGLAGFESARFQDSDLLFARLSYLFPLVKNLEFGLRAESGGVFPGLTEARASALEYSWGAALRFRTEVAVFGALGCDWSREKARIWFALGGVE